MKLQPDDYAQHMRAIELLMRQAYEHASLNRFGAAEVLMDEIVVHAIMAKHSLIALGGDQQQKLKLRLDAARDHG